MSRINDRLSHFIKLASKIRLKLKLKLGIEKIILKFRNDRTLIFEHLIIVLTNLNCH
jgi:hypothetical protein